MQVRLQFLEGGFDPPALAVHPGNVFGIGCACRQARQQRQFLVAIARGLLQNDTDAAEPTRIAATVADQDLQGNRINAG
jgi:hypothetical protein